MRFCCLKLVFVSTTTVSFALFYLPTKSFKICWPQTLILSLILETRKRPINLLEDCFVLFFYAFSAQVSLTCIFEKATNDDLSCGSMLQRGVMKILFGEMYESFSLNEIHSVTQQWSLCAYAMQILILHACFPACFVLANCWPWKEVPTALFCFRTADII